MYDKETFNRILEILHDEKRSLEKMAELEDRRMQVLGENGWPKLEEIDGETLLVVEELNALEKERLFTGNRMLHANNPDTISALISAVESSDREELIQLRNDITAVIQRIQFLKSVSEALLQDKKALVDMAMKAAKGESGLSEYTEDGTVREVNTGKASIMFSRRI
jgi:flagellar biosynthesis/type III secretory pathway chaperone